MKPALIACVVCIFLAAPAFASCGSSSCPIDLHNLLGADVGHLVVDLSFQYIDQEHIRGFALSEPHEEIRTINRIANLQFSYAPTSRFRSSVIAPFVSRSHEHLELATNDRERWSFSNFGDVAVQGRWRAAQHVWLLGGVKLPTGARHEMDVTGSEEAEVTMQPGTGSTDVTVGATYENGFIRDTALEGPLGHATTIPYFASITYRANGRGTHDYRRGNETQISVGTQYPLRDGLDLLLQGNARLLEKDEVGSTEENPDLTGGRFFYVSPGLRLGMAYAYVQVPIYQHVNGRQLVARVNYLIGIQHRF